MVDVVVGAHGRYPCCPRAVACGTSCDVGKVTARARRRSAAPAGSDACGSSAPSLVGADQDRPLHGPVINARAAIAWQAEGLPLPMPVPGAAPVLDAKMRQTPHGAAAHAFGTVLPTQRQRRDWDAEGV